MNLFLFYFSIHSVSLLFVIKQEVQIVQVMLLGEEERGQKPYQILCFVNHIQVNEFISPDAMAKLRQVSYK